VVHFRRAEKEDIPALARMRAAEWETEAYWQDRIASYLEGTSNPLQALEPRAVFVALDGEALVGFVAGHLTRRLGCTGELEWIDVVAPHRGKELGSALLRVMAAWFVEQKATHVCVDPGNAAARSFYARNGASALNAHWMVWLDIGKLLRG
jgi:GNAT superfamily N-acetyltransferase